MISNTNWFLHYKTHKTWEEELHHENVLILCEKNIITKNTIKNSCWDGDIFNNIDTFYSKFL